MKLDVNGHETFVSTGGRDFTADGEVLLFLHGSGQNHLSFILQGRFFANRGWSVLVPDFPGHGLSAGEPLTTIPAMAEWCVALLDTAGVSKAHVVGHSQGGLVILELARNAPERVASTTFVATALAVPVNDALLDLARSAEPKAIAAMTDWGHGRHGHRHDHTLPGVVHLGFGERLMAENAEGSLLVDLTACNDYLDGPDAAAALTCPSLCILATEDRMTPIRGGRKLAASLPDAQLVEVPAGHMLPSEAPMDVNRALRRFLDTQAAD